MVLAPTAGHYARKGTDRRMDPNDNLSEQLALAELIQRGNCSEEDYDRLAELVLALDEWIRGGGFLPDVWRAR